MLVPFLRKNKPSPPFKVPAWVSSTTISLAAPAGHLAIAQSLPHRPNLVPKPCGFSLPNHSPKWCLPFLSLQVVCFPPHRFSPGLSRPLPKWTSSPYSPLHTPKLSDRACLPTTCTHITSCQPTFHRSHCQWSQRLCSPDCIDTSLTCCPGVSLTSWGRAPMGTCSAKVLGQI